MVLTQNKTRLPRDPEKFPTSQLFLLGEYGAGDDDLGRLDLLANASDLQSTRTRRGTNRSHVHLPICLATRSRLSHR